MRDLALSIAPNGLITEVRPLVGLGCEDVGKLPDIELRNEELRDEDRLPLCRDAVWRASNERGTVVAKEPTAGDIVALDIGVGRPKTGAFPPNRVT